MKILSLGIMLVAVAACGGKDQVNACPANPSFGGGCAVEGATCRRSTDLDQCSQQWLLCRSGHFTDEWSAEEVDICQQVPDFTCTIEGTGGCETPPPGGECFCNDQGQYACRSNCPDACPLTAPTVGTPCDTGLGLEETCPYAATTCSCDLDGNWACSDG